MTYAVNPMAPFPKRWRDKTGPIRVIAGPAQGYLMVKRPRCFPFVLTVSQICGAKKHPTLGPFEPVGVTLRLMAIEGDER